jgi:WD40 repeat protein
MDLVGAWRYHRAISYVSFSADGQLLSMCGGLDTMTSIIEVGQPPPHSAISVLQGRGQVAVGAAFHPAKPVLATIGGGITNAVLWDIANLERPQRLSDLVGDRVNGKVIKNGRIIYGTWGPWSGAFSPDGQTLAIGSTGNALTLLDVTDPSTPRLPPGTVPNPRPRMRSSKTRAIAFHPHLPRLIAVNGDGTVTVWDTSQPSKPRRASVTPAHGKIADSITVSADGALLATGGWDGKAILWEAGDRDEPRPIATLDLAGNVHAALSQVAPVLVTANRESKQARLRAWDISTPARPELISESAIGKPMSIAASPEGPVAVGCVNGVVQLWRP